ncbi:MAG: hypothetical protein WBB29_18350 [Geitlerinemataceae cyanobacterium]
MSKSVASTIPPRPLRRSGNCDRSTVYLFQHYCGILATDRIF